MHPKQFRLITLKDATEFIDGLPDNVREKVFYNIRKVQAGIKDKELFKKLGDSEIWEFRTLWQGWLIACLLFGIKMVRQWL